eukprot:363154-Chlamydomonas_euryale.AAC.3
MALHTSTPECGRMLRCPAMQLYAALCHCAVNHDAKIIQKQHRRRASAAAQCIHVPRERIHWQNVTDWACDRVS